MLIDTPWVNKVSLRTLNFQSARIHYRVLDFIHVLSPKTKSWCIKPRICSFPLIRSANFLLVLLCSFWSISFSFVEWLALESIIIYPRNFGSYLWTVVEIIPGLNYSSALTNHSRVCTCRKMEMFPVHLMKMELQIHFPYFRKRQYKRLVSNLFKEMIILSSFLKLWEVRFINPGTPFYGNNAILPVL